MYIYQADLYCDACGSEICERLVKSGKAQEVIPWEYLRGKCDTDDEIELVRRAENAREWIPTGQATIVDSDALAALWDTFQLDPQYSRCELSETSYDSGDYPGYSYESGDVESDSVHHCGSGETCLEAIELPSGRKIGALLTDTLTKEGQAQWYEDIRSDKERSEVKLYWADHVSGCNWPKDLYEVRLDPSDEDPFRITCDVQGPYAHEWADSDGSIEGDSWETVDDDPECGFVYAIISWHPSVIEDLQREGYDLDLSNFSPPDDDDIAVATHMHECDECRDHYDFSRAKRHRDYLVDHPAPDPRQILLPFPKSH